MEVHVIDNNEFPFERALGKEIGKYVKSEHEKNGVILHMKNGVKEIKGANGKVTSILLNDLTEIAADMVIIGAGMSPATDFLGSIVDKDSRGGIVCDHFLCSSDKDIFAAGDVASFPYWLTGKRLRIEHYVTA